MEEMRKLQPIFQVMQWQKKKNSQMTNLEIKSIDTVVLIIEECSLHWKVAGEYMVNHRPTELAPLELSL